MITNLAFQGGGVLGISYVGVLRELEKAGILKNIKRTAGSSAGAIISAVIAMYKDNLDKIEEIQMETPYSKFADDTFGIIRDSIRLMRKFGWHRTNYFEKWFKSLLVERFGDGEITFEEMFSITGIDLVVTGCNVSKGVTVPFSHLDTPKLEVWKGVMISMAIPGYFTAAFLEKKYIDDKGNIIGNPYINGAANKNNDTFVDGGVLASYPLWAFDKDITGDDVFHVVGRNRGYVNNSTLGIRQSPRIENEGDIIDSKDAETNSFVNFAATMIDLIHSYGNQVHLDDYDWNRTIQIDLGDKIKGTDFNLTKEDEKFLIDQGSKAAKEFLDWLKTT